MSKVKNNVPTAFQTRILERIPELDIKSLYEQYREAYKRQGRHQNYKPSKTDLNIAHDFKNGMLYRELSQKYKMSHSKIATAIDRVARAHFFNNN